MKLVTNLTVDHKQNALLRDLLTMERERYLALFYDLQRQDELLPEAYTRAKVELQDGLDDLDELLAKLGVK